VSDNVQVSKLFRHSKPMYANAVVGSDWNQSFYVYANSYKAAFEVMVENLVDTDFRDVDKKVFPLVYSCRHAVELYLKGIIVGACSLRRTPIPNIKTHNLVFLWEQLKVLMKKADRRFKSGCYVYLDEVIADFNGYDLPDVYGEAFRYPIECDESSPHEKFRYINICTFYDQIMPLLETLETLSDFTNYLAQEYSLGIHTNSLSRYDIHRIAEMLPPLPWVDSRISEVKSAVVEKYQITRSEFDKAVSFIKRDRRMSSILGRPVGLKYLNNNQLDFIEEAHAIVKNIESPYIKSRPLGSSGLNVYSTDDPVSHDAYFREKASLVIMELATWDREPLTELYVLLCNSPDPWSISERYDAHVDFCLKAEHLSDEYMANKVLYGLMRLDGLKFVLEEIGLSSLVEDKFGL